MPTISDDTCAHCGTTVGPFVNLHDDDEPALLVCQRCDDPDARTRADRGAYAEEAAAQDRFLDQKLAQIRAHEAAGDITTIEAADARVAAMEHHLAAVRNLRTEYFGSE